jgi:hypothetical protein
MFDFLYEPWPWYIAGPLIGLTVPGLLIMGGKKFGLSSNFRHVCAACFPGDIDFFKYDWKTSGTWNLIFLVGIIIGGFLAGYVWENPNPVDISQETVADLQALGVTSFQGLVPADLFSWANLGSIEGLSVLAIGGFLVGFGTRYAGGCTSGHAITGISDLQVASVVATIAFFIGGLLMTHLLLPFIIS